MSCSATSNNLLQATLMLLGALALFATAIGCDTGPPSTTGRAEIQLTDLFQRAERTVDSEVLSLESVLELGSEKLAGRERTVIRQHPAGTLRYRLRIPHDAVLRWGYCMAPHTWLKSPDGVRFHIRARRIKSGKRAGRQITLFSAALDPKNNPGHRRVFEQQVDLARLGGAECELEFTLSHGPRKNVKWDNGIWVEPRIEFPSGSIELPAADPSRPDILLVTVEGLRADVLPFNWIHGDSGPAPAAAPVIARLAAEGLRAATAFTPSTLTIPSYASILTGAAPEAHGLHGEKIRGRTELPTAGKRFAERGYRTAAFVGTSRLSARQTGLARDFDLYDCPVAGQRPVKETLLGLLDWIRQGDGRPSFCWLQVNELQPPLSHLRKRDRHYYPQGGYNRRDESILRLLPHFERRLDLKKRWYRWLHDVTTTDYVEASYLGQVDEVDRQLGLVIDELRIRSQLKNTVVVVTANRGLALGDRGMYFTSESLQPGVTRVPLIIRLPGRIPTSRLPETAPCTTADILPTLLGLLPPTDAGTEATTGGIDLLKALRDTTPLERRGILLEGHVGPPVLPNRFALVTGGYKLTESLSGPQQRPPETEGTQPWASDSNYHDDELFQIYTDPDELKNLDGSRPLADLQNLMHGQLRSMIHISTRQPKQRATE